MIDRKKYNLVGNTFTHLTNGNKGYSVHGKESQHIEWVQDGSGAGTFYIDHTISTAWQDGRTGPKYAWLLESRSITPQIVNNVRRFWQKYCYIYDAIFTHNKELLALDPKFKWVPAQGFWIKEPRIYPKSKLVSMISSAKAECQGHRDRLAWVERLQGKVDLYGRGFQEIDLKEQGLCDYMFSVAIENGQYETYFTEKLLDCFATGTVPVYLGAPDIGDHFNAAGIITLSEDVQLTPELYQSMLPAIQDNLERARKMEILEDFIWEHYIKEQG
jgi:hypothetical protein